VTSTPLLPFEDGDDRTLYDAFVEYHRANPEVYATICRFADEALRAGRTRIGIGMLTERLRWYTTVEARSADGFKFNNNYRPFYSRMWLRDHPEHPDFFQTREQRHTAEWSAA
jgi:hypothetical protein